MSSPLQSSHNRFPSKPIIARYSTKQAAIIKVTYINLIQSYSHECGWKSLAKSSMIDTQIFLTTKENCALKKKISKSLYTN